MSDGRKKLSAFEQLKSLVKGKRGAKKDNSQNQLSNNDDRDHKANSNRNQSQKTHTQNQKRASHRMQKKQTEDSQVQIRIPQFGQKMNRQQTQYRPKQESEAVTISVNLTDQMEVESARLFRWLCKNFPNCFSPKDKKPLKIGINDDIIKAFLAHTQKEVHFGVLTRVLRRYVGDQAYQKAILQYKQRFNLQGEAVEDLSEEHLEHARERLEELKEKARLRAEGIDPRTVFPPKERRQKKDVEKDIEDNQASKENIENAEKNESIEVTETVEIVEVSQTSEAINVTEEVKKIEESENTQQVEAEETQTSANNQNEEKH